MSTATIVRPALGKDATDTSIRMGDTVILRKSFLDNIEWVSGRVIGQVPATFELLIAVGKDRYLRFSSEVEVTS